MSEPTQRELRRFFDYRDGELIWRISPGNRIPAGRIAGCINPSSGYVRVRYKGVTYEAHRLIYIWHHGFAPSLIDHSNHVRTDNRIANLRPLSKAQNCDSRAGPNQNSTTGFRGVYWHCRVGKYYVKHRNKSLGYFSTLEAAKQRAAREHNHAAA